MGENKREVEYEFEKILDEIPNATSGNPHFEEFGRSKGMTLGGRDINRIQRPPLTKNAQANGIKLSDDQSLASAFGQLNISDGLAERVSLSNGYGSSTLGGCQYPRMTHNLNMGSRIRNLGQENSDIFNTENSVAAAIPMSNALQFSPNLPITALEVPSSNNQPYIMNPQSMVHCFHSPDNSQPAWRSLAQENYYNYRLCQQNLYYQLEAQPALQNFASRIVNQSGMPQFFEMSIPQGAQQTEHGQIFNSYGFPRCFKQSDHSLSSLDRPSQQSLSEKILTRLNGVGSLRSAKFGTGNEYHINQNAKTTSNGHLCYGMCSPTAQCFQDDGLNSWDLTHGAACLRNCESKLMPWKYNVLADASSNRIHLMAKDQHGCRLLQRKISEGSPKDVEKIFAEIIDHIVELMTDPFGNYLVQKLLEVCNDDQQTRILRVITRNSGDLIRISCDMHGTRVIQKVIETLKTPEHISIVVNSLKPCIVTLMKNTNGNHVAQRCLQHLMPEYSQFLFDAAAAYCVELATDRHGCCVLQKCLNYCGGKQRRHLIHEITSNSLILSQDPFGNYVVQFVFELQLPQATMNILSQLEGNFADLSMQKYSSNVVEKCLEHAGDEHCARIIRELIDSPRLDQIMQDPYGNYVIQAALGCAKGPIKSALVEVIEAHIPVLRTSPFGKKVLSCNSLKK